MNFNTFSSKENDSKSSINAKRVAGALAVAGAVFAGGCENSGSSEVRHYSDGGSSSSEQIPYGKECKEHPDAVFSTAIESLTKINKKPETLNYMIRDSIKIESSDYSDFAINLDDEQIQQFNQGVEIVDNKLLTERNKPIQVTVLNPGGWDALNIDRASGTFEGDICVGAGDKGNNNQLRVED